MYDLLLTLDGGAQVHFPDENNCLRISVAYQEGDPHVAELRARILHQVLTPVDESFVPLGTQTLKVGSLVTEWHVYGRPRSFFWLPTRSTAQTPD